MAALVTLDYVKNLAILAGDIVKDAFHDRQKEVECKISQSDLVTKSDVKVENFLKETIKKTFPDHKFLCEESATEEQTLGDEPTWIIDPIDGTTNFVHCISHTAISIAYAVRKQVLIGVVHNAASGEMFYAEKGKGAFCNGERLSVTGEKDIGKCLVATGFCVSTLRQLSDPKIIPERRKRVELVKDCVFRNIEVLVTKCQDVRRFGAIAVDLAFLAAGRLDGVAELSPKEWDIAAGVLLVEEAGGFVTDFAGRHPIDLGERQCLAGASREVCEQLRPLLSYPNFKT